MYTDTCSYIHIYIYIYICIYVYISFYLGILSVIPSVCLDIFNDRQLDLLKAKNLM
jgi:hypothetical protein